MKKLNNKGFTLIELLAVVVILAVVMGIAMNSVLSSMNKSRGGTLADTAQVIAQGIATRYTEELVEGDLTSVYDAYDFTASHVYYITADVAEEFNISSASYLINDSSTAIDTATTVAGSFFNFDASAGKVVVCMIANPTGKVNVAGYANGGTVTFNSVNYTISAKMYACSNGEKSW